MVCMKTRLVLLPVLLVLAKAFSQDAVLPALIVKPLDGDLSQIQGWQPALGEGLAEMLVTELSKINKFELLEASAMKDLINEIDLGEAGYVAK